LQVKTSEPHNLHLNWFQENNSVYLISGPQILIANHVLHQLIPAPKIMVFSVFKTATPQ
jgi:hypothetical protein